MTRITGGDVLILTSSLASFICGSLVLATFALFEDARILNYGYLYMLTFSDTLFGLAVFSFSLLNPEDLTWECNLNGAHEVNMQYVVCLLFYMNSFSCL